MYQGELFNHLIVYMIPDELRRRAMERCLSRHGFRIEYDETFKAEMRAQYGPSPEYDGQYETLLDRRRFQEMLRDIRGILDLSQDRALLFLMNAIDHEGEPNEILLGLSAGEDPPRVEGLYA
jgi:hypothetical protein